MRHLVLAIALVTICGATTRVDVVVKRNCVISISAAQDFECRGPDTAHMSCRGIAIVYKPTCASYDVVRDLSESGQK